MTEQELNRDLIIEETTENIENDPRFKKLQSDWNNLDIEAKSTKVLLFTLPAIIIVIFFMVKGKGSSESLVASLLMFLFLSPFLATLLPGINDNRDKKKIKLLYQYLEETEGEEVAINVCESIIEQHPSYLESRVAKPVVKPIIETVIKPVVEPVVEPVAEPKEATFEEALLEAGKWVSIYLLWKQITKNWDSVFDERKK